MEAHIADIVLSLSGRDKGVMLLVVGEEGDFLFLANGRARRAETPKKKRRRHVSLLGSADVRTRQKLEQNGRLNNSDIRRAIAFWMGDDDTN